MRRVLPVATILSLTLLPSIAEARPTLSKTRAWLTARQGAQYLWLHSRATDWAVENAASCARQSRRTVDCDYQLYDETTDPAIVCDGTLRIRLTRFGRVTWKPLGDPDCN